MSRRWSDLRREVLSEKQLEEIDRQVKRELEAFSVPGPSLGRKFGKLLRRTHKNEDVQIKNGDQIVACLVSLKRYLKFKAL